MKDKPVFYLFAALAMLLIPAAALLPQKNSQEQASKTAEESSISDDTQANGYRVPDVQSGNMPDVPLRDYLIGAVCAEMPAAYEPEALKAQAVAVRSYAERIAARSRQSPPRKPQRCRFLQRSCGSSRIFHAGGGKSGIRQ